MAEDQTPTPVIAAEEEAIDLSDVRLDDYLVLFVFWALAFVVFLQFFTRYVLNDSLGWTEEIARYLLIGVTFIGSVMAVRKGAHIAVELVYRWSGRGVARALRTFNDAVGVAFYVAMAWFTAQLAGRTRQMMVSIDVPKAWLYWGVAACFGAMALYGLIVLIDRLRGRDPESHAGASVD